MVTASSRRTPIHVAVLALLVLSLSSPTSASVGRERVGFPAGSMLSCHPSKLRARFHDGGVALGTVVMSLAIRNIGRPCSVRGYAVLRLFRGSRPLPTRVRHGGLSILNRKARTISLSHRGWATILIVYSDNPVGPERRCPLGNRLTIRLPGEKGVTVARVSIGACDSGLLRESPILAGLRAVP
jgi:Domain of unknown function (DUF4232)